jgi:hypothetical protein
MAHYAFLDENNVVTEVITGVDENITQTDVDGTEVGGSTEAWENWYSNFRGQACKRTSYNNNFRKNYAGIGYTYNAAMDAFIPPKPFPSWTLNENTCNWEAPVSMPSNDRSWLWNEESQQWTERP